MALFLLSGGDQERCACELGIVDRPHRIAESRRHMDVAGGKLAGCTGKAVRHGDHDGFLKAEHISEIGVVLERIHQR